MPKTLIKAATLLLIPCLVLADPAFSAGFQDAVSPARTIVQSSLSSRLSQEAMSARAIPFLTARFAPFGFATLLVASSASASFHPLIRTLASSHLLLYSIPAILSLAIGYLAVGGILRSGGILWFIFNAIKKLAKIKVQRRYTSTIGRTLGVLAVIFLSAQSAMAQGPAAKFFESLTIPAFVLISILAVKCLQGGWHWTATQMGAVAIPMAEPAANDSVSSTVQDKVGEPTLDENVPAKETHADQTSIAAKLIEIAGDPNKLYLTPVKPDAERKYRQYTRPLLRSQKIQAMLFPEKALAVIKEVNETNLELIAICLATLLASKEGEKWDILRLTTDVYVIASPGEFAWVLYAGPDKQPRVDGLESYLAGLNGALPKETKAVVAAAIRKRTGAFESFAGEPTWTNFRTWYLRNRAALSSKTPTAVANRLLREDRYKGLRAQIAHNAPSLNYILKHEDTLRAQLSFALGQLTPAERALEKTKPRAFRAALRKHFYPENLVRVRDEKILEDIKALDAVHDDVGFAKRAQLAHVSVARERQLRKYLDGKLRYEPATFKDSPAFNALILELLSMPFAQEILNNHVPEVRAVVADAPAPRSASEPIQLTWRQRDAQRLKNRPPQAFAGPRQSTLWRTATSGRYMFSIASVIPILHFLGPTLANAAGHLYQLIATIHGSLPHTYMASLPIIGLGVVAMFLQREPGDEPASKLYSLTGVESSLRSMLLEANKSSKEMEGHISALKAVAKKDPGEAMTVHTLFGSEEVSTPKITPELAEAYGDQDILDKQIALLEGLLGDIQAAQGNVDRFAQSLRQVFRENGDVPAAKWLRHEPRMEAIFQFIGDRGELPLRKAGSLDWIDMPSAAINYKEKNNNPPSSVRDVRSMDDVVNVLETMKSQVARQKRLHVLQPVSFPLDEGAALRQIRLLNDLHEYAKQFRNRMDLFAQALRITNQNSVVDDENSSSKGAKALFNSPQIQAIYSFVGGGEGPYLINDDLQFIPAVEVADAKIFTKFDLPLQIERITGFRALDIAVAIQPGKEYRQAFQLRQIVSGLANLSTLGVEYLGAQFSQFGNNRLDIVRLFFKVGGTHFYVLFTKSSGGEPVWHAETARIGAEDVPGSLDSKTRLSEIVDSRGYMILRDGLEGTPMHNNQKGVGLRKSA